MSRLLQALFGRLPIGWLQLTHNRTRFAAALAGVAFANVLVFVQLGIMNSMGAATLRPYDFFQADIMISAGDANSLTDGGNVARQWMLQAMADRQAAGGTQYSIDLSGAVIRDDSDIDRIIDGFEERMRSIQRDMWR